MKPGGQVSAAIQILDRVRETGRPAETVLRNWGRHNRIAGARDRAAIGQFVFQVLRHRSRCAWRMSDDSSRSLMIGYFALSRKPREEWVGWFDGSEHGPAPLTAEELALVENGPLEAPKMSDKVSVPDWLMPDFERVFGDETEAELEALLRRAPIDLLVNTVKVARKAARAHLKRQDIEVRATPYSARGLRLETGSGVRPRQILQSKPFQEGEIDLQDEGSQLIVDWCEARESGQVVDLCAGGGGKTLGLAGAMNNKGQIYACDTNEKRLNNLMPRLTRAGVRNVQLRQLVDWAPGESETDPQLQDIVGRADLVLVDAPCSGSGSWRRHPDAKWRLTEEMLATYVQMQSRILRRAAQLVNPGGHLVYATCSLTPRENDQQIAHFLTEHAAFELDDIETEVPARKGNFGLLLTPLKTETDGFFVSRLRRKS